MAEPLSITASILAVLGAAEKTGKGLERLRTLHNAPDELQYVLNEISDMRIVLRSVQKALTAVTECEAEDIKGLIQSGKLSRIRERLRDRRDSLVAALVGSLFTINHGIRLDIREISLVTRGEPDQSLIRLDHPQAASMQHALEELLSRDSYQSSDTLQPAHSDTYQEEEPASGSRQR
ncbi:hypothetical protein CC80DRAFT_553045 [Byssothecium circinans]|uniref:Fungal N-terminal domain-containing protein n=1 Tax=Byssothecium circinans TaxID=147558 RepID=A0A6A5TIX2_9PLEO|nr:hypothetical protein CC80DRAFT_553045 [Byssothecium circinans]